MGKRLIETILVRLEYGRRGTTYMRGELGAVEFTLCDNGGVSVRSFIILSAEAMAGMLTGADME
jgi:hypothetical protein